MSRYLHACGLGCLVAAVLMMGVTLAHIHVYGQFVSGEDNRFVLLLETLLVPGAVVYLAYLWHDKIMKNWD